MERPALYIFSKRQEILLSISRCVRHTGFECKKLKHRFDPKEHTSTYFFLEEITSVLDKEPPEILLNAVAIIDVTDVDNDISSSLNPISDSDSTGQIVSSLILAYPEVYWIFLGTYYNKLKESLSWEKEHFVDVTEINRIIELLKRHQDGYRPLFDPSGLRTYIKETVIETEKALERDNKSEAENDQMLSIVSECLKKRKTQSAVVIDEELPFTFLNGYIAYRSGHRCFMITSQYEMENILRNEKSGEKIAVSLEDLDIKLCGMNDEDSKKLYNPEDRAKEYKALSIVKKRLYVTGVATEEVRKRYGKQIIDKPYAGVYYLKNKIIENEIIGSVCKNYLGFWKQFICLFCEIMALFLLPAIYFKNFIHRRLCKYQTNDHKPLVEENNSKNSHSASSKLLIIVDYLIERARKILNNSKSCQGNIHGAILALEAKELIHGRSMTTALEAVSLQHQLEVRAECCFYGVAHEIVTKQRFEDVSREVDEIIKTMDKPQIKKLAQAYNAQIEISNNFRLIFKEFEQFDEEDKCINIVRRLRQGLHFYSKLAFPNIDSVWQLPVSMLVERYFNSLVSSWRYILLWIAIWILIFAGLYCWCDHTFDLQCLWHSALTFFEMQNAGIIKCQKNWVFNVLLFSELVIAYGHLGIFIAYLYQKLSRR